MNQEELRELGCPEIILKKTGEAGIMHVDTGTQGLKTDGFGTINEDVDAILRENQQ